MLPKIGKIGKVFYKQIKESSYFNKILKEVNLANLFDKDKKALYSLEK